MNWEVIWKASLILAIAPALAATLRRSAASTRHVVWMIALGTAGVVPILVWLAPAWETRAEMVRIVTSATAANGAGTSAAWSWLGYVWIAGAIACLIRLAVAHGRLASISKEAAEIERFGEVAVKTSAEIESPMTWGVRRPVILIPQGGVSARVLDHELAHVDRGDGLWQLMAQLVCALYWFHPLVWWAERQAAEERERACDDAVLRSGATACDYAADLVNLARKSLPPAVAVAAVGPAGALEQRLRAILDGTIRRNGLSRRWLGGISVAALLLAGGLSAVRAQEDEVYKIGGDVKAPRLIHKVEPQYTERAKDEKVAGTVVLYLEIDKNGLPENARVTRSLHPDLDEKAVEAVLQWRFEPGKKKGNPVRVAATVEVNFKLL